MFLYCTGFASNRSFHSHFRGIYWGDSKNGRILLLAFFVSEIPCKAILGFRVAYKVEYLDFALPPMLLALGKPL